MSEHQDQCALFTWANHAQRTYPELRLMFAIPNAGKRSFQLGKWMVAEGLRKGVPDVCLPVARKGHGALYIELKHGKKKPSPEQIEFQGLLNMHGNKAVTCWGWESARAVILDYLAI